MVTVTRKSKRELERTLDALDKSPSGDAPSPVTIRSVVVDEDGEPAAVARRLETWQDETGEWHSERTEFDEEEGAARLAELLEEGTL